ncbi:MAG: hypothetical protein ACI4TE_07875, partial [Alphaproteobacteria bacterium]
LDGAIDLFLGHISFLVIYLAAAVGWIFYRCIPPVVLSVLEMSDQRRVIHLRELQTKLVAKWGEEVIDGGDVKTAAALGKKSMPFQPASEATSDPGDVKTPLS